MISILLAIISIFPISFFFYALSERFIARHELRVGKQIYFFRFVYQTWVDATVEMKKQKNIWVWAMTVLQMSIVFLLDFNFHYAVFLYLAVNSFLMVHVHAKAAVVDRIENDRVQVRQMIAMAVAVLCFFGCFISSRETSLAGVEWSFIQLLFVIPFQLAGMIIFGEHPFQGMSKKPVWIESARFYVWSLLSAKMFLGGSVLFFDFHLKAAFLYIACRLLGMYVPTFFHRDLVRVSILYLLPVTGLLWLIAMLLHGMSSDGIHV